MRNSKLSSAFIACLAVGLIAALAITVVAINGLKPENDNSDTLAVSDNQSDNSASSIVSTDSTQSSETQTSSETQNSSSSVTSSSTNSSGQRPSQFPENDGDKVCYLTFDDGPSSTVTKSILETLAKYNVKATFFVAGTGNMSMLKSIHEGGHAIGLHTDTHDYNLYKSADAYFKDLQAVSDKVYEQTGVRSNILRFPGGSSNTVSKNKCEGIMSYLVKEVENRGYAYFDWNVDSNDANSKKMQVIDGKKRTPKDTIVSSVLNGAKNKDKICVLMHDISVKTTTAEALPEIIEGLMAQGYRFDVLSTSAPTFHFKVAN